MPLSPLARVATAGDFGTNLAPPAAFDRWTMANLDVTLHLSRLPESDWMLLDARSEIAGNGVATGMQSQSQWLNSLKSDCNFCHQLGNGITRHARPLAVVDDVGGHIVEFFHAVFGGHQAFGDKALNTVFEQLKCLGIKCHAVSPFSLGALLLFQIGLTITMSKNSVFSNF